MHFAFSEEIKGAGVIAGGPMYCAMGDMNKALLNCMSQPLLIDVNSLIKKTDKLEKDGLIDATSNLRDSPVFIFHGSKDSTVK